MVILNGFPVVILNGFPMVILNGYPMVILNGYPMVILNGYPMVILLLSYIMGCPPSQYHPQNKACVACVHDF